MGGRVEVQKQTQRKRSVACPEQRPGLQMWQEDIDRFIDEWNGVHLQESSARMYRVVLLKFYKWLPDGKLIHAETISQWLDELASEGYSGKTLNYYRGVCNIWLKFMGALKYRKEEKYSPRVSTLLVTTREEYHRMLEVAKSMRDELMFLLIKTFASTGITIQDLRFLTVEAVSMGEVRTAKKKIHLPPGLCGELLDYAGFHDKTGVIFSTRSGKAVQEPWISVRLKKMSQAAGLANGKGTARSLQKLFWNSKAELEEKGTSDVDQAMDDLLEREQASYGWRI